MTRRSDASYVLLYAYLAVLIGISLVATLAVWPYAPDELEPFNSRFSAEMRVLVLVGAGGVLGGSLTAFRGLFIEAGKLSRFRRAPLTYLLDALTALPLALLVYVGLRGLILSPAAGVKQLNASGLLFLSLWVGFYGPASLYRAVASVFRPESREAEVDDRLEQITAALGVATLDNYRGNICWSLEDVGGQPVPRLESDQYAVDPGKRYVLRIWFDPQPPEGIEATPVEISGGADASVVHFALEGNSNIGRLDPRNHSVSFGVTEHSQEIRFTLSDVRLEQNGRVVVEVLQKNRLVEVVSLDLVTASEKAL